MSIHNLAAGVTGMTSNAYFVEGETPAVVDTGSGFDIIAAIEDRELPAPEHVVLTHTHPDHVGNVDALVSTFDVPVYGYDTEAASVTDYLDDGETVRLGDHDYEAWFTPGHAPDHLCLYSATAGVLFCGDLIFPNGGVGRTDLPGCDHEQLVESIESVRSRLTTSLQSLYAGHMPPVESGADRHVEAAARSVGL